MKRFLAVHFQDQLFSGNEGVKGIMKSMSKAFLRRLVQKLSWLLQPLATTLPVSLSSGPLARQSVHRWSKFHGGCSSDCRKNDPERITRRLLFGVPKVSFQGRPYSTESSNNFKKQLKLEEKRKLPGEWSFLEEPLSSLRVRYGSSSWMV